MLKSFSPIVMLLLSSLTIYAQDYPYPLTPANTTTVNSNTINFTWKGADNFTAYSIEIYDCTYVPGSNFNSLNLEDYELTNNYSVAAGNETSGFTHNEKRIGNFVAVEDGGNTLLSHNYDFNDNVTNSVSNLQGSDFEGITYLYDDYFAIIEERFGYLHFLKFNYGNTNLSGLSLQNTIQLTHPQITGANDGYEGVTYNPISNKFYASKEYNPVTLFEFNAPTAPGFAEAVNLTTPFDISQVSWAPQDASGLYHMGLNKQLSATTTGEHLLILSKNSGAIYETDLNGNLISQLNFDLSGLLGSLFNGGFKAEGITYNDGKIYISEDNNGYYIVFQNWSHQDPFTATGALVHSETNLTSPQFDLPICMLQSQSDYCWRIIAQNASGQTVESEYFSFTTAASQIDYSAGASCNDGDSCTVNDMQDGNCNCVGTYSGDIDGDGICNALDSCPNFNNGLIGQPCNDNNATTENDVYTSNCICEGTLIVCDPFGTACNDGNPCTVNDIEDGNCNCAGTASGDSDNDGICNQLDSCPYLNNNLIGNPCNDNNPSTINDVYTSNCNCVGVAPISNICISINDGNNDVEEYGSSGAMYFDSSDLEFVYDGNNRGNQVVGLRFPNFPVPQGADILNAYLQFTVDETNTGTTNLTIRGEDRNNSNSFNTNNQNISNRNKTSANVSWSPSSWFAAGASGADQRTPDISGVIDEITSRQGYSQGNAITIIIEGSGERTAESYEGSPANAPKLCVDYSIVPVCPAIGTACDDNDNCTNNDVIIDNNCTCAGTPMAICNSNLCLGDLSIVDPGNSCNCVVTTVQVMGCMNANACNFDAAANCDDGSCQTAPTCNNNLCAGDLEMVDPDNACDCIVTDVQVMGCMDANACNFNVAANCDDGSCQTASTCNNDPCAGDLEIVDPNNACDCVVTAVQVSGCMNVNACNYNPAANCNNYYCTFLPQMVIVHQNPAIVNGGTYQAQQTIQSDINFTDMSTVNYYAGQNIELQIEFSVPAGKSFSAIIEEAICP